jgi:hypothetical protein
VTLDQLFEQPAVLERAARAHLLASFSSESRSLPLRHPLRRTAATPLAAATSARRQVFGAACLQDADANER